MNTGRTVVMKFFDPMRLGDVATYEHFQRAIAVGKLLKHPGIPQVLEVCEDAQTPSIVMEYIEGESLRRFNRLALSARCQTS